MNPLKAPDRAAHLTEPHSPDPLAKLDDVSSDGRTVIFDPDRCEDQGCWLQADNEHVINVQEAV